MEQEKMTTEQVLGVTIGVLSEISVPVKYKAQIAEPIDGAINNLVLVLQAMREEKKNRRVAEAIDNAPEGANVIRMPEDGEGQEGVEYGTEADTE